MPANDTGLKAKIGRRGAIRSILGASAAAAAGGFAALRKPEQAAAFPWYCGCKVYGYCWIGGSCYYARVAYKGGAWPMCFGGSCGSDNHQKAANSNCSGRPTCPGY